VHNITLHKIFYRDTLREPFTDVFLPFTDGDLFFVRVCGKISTSGGANICSPPLFLAEDNAPNLDGDSGGQGNFTNVNLAVVRGGVGAGEHLFGSFLLDGE
jgi:hypothetical protein